MTEDDRINEGENTSDQPVSGLVIGVSATGVLVPLYAIYAYTVVLVSGLALNVPRCSGQNVLDAIPQTSAAGLPFFLSEPRPACPQELANNFRAV